MERREEWVREVRRTYERIKAHDRPYAVRVMDRDIIVFPGVFSPAYFTDSAWFAEELPKIVRRHSLLEIGTGTGIIALFCAMNGADVTATDVNPAAVENARKNFLDNKIKVSTYQGDLYDPLPKSRRYDFIFWNHPFNKGDRPDEEMLLRAGFDYKYSALERYVAKAHLLLKAKGRLLLGTGGFATLADIGRIAKRHGYTMELLRRTDIPLSPGSTVENDYRIYEFSRKL